MNHVQHWSECYLELPRSLNREDEDDSPVLQEGLGEFALIARRGGPDTFLLRNIYVPHIAALHDEVAH